MEDGMEIPLKKKTRNKTSKNHCKFIAEWDPAIPLLGIYPEEAKIEKYTCTPGFTAALFAIARTRKQLDVH